VAELGEAPAALGFLQDLLLLCLARLGLTFFGQHASHDFIARALLHNIVCTIHAHQHLQAGIADLLCWAEVSPAALLPCCCLQLQSVQLPFALIPVLAFNASSTLMGMFVNSKAMIGCTVAVSLVVMIINVSGVLAFFEAALSGASLYVWGALAAGIVLYLLFVGYLFLHATAAAGLLPPIMGFVAQQPGGVSRGSVGGGVFVALPFDSDSSEAEGDEEAGQEVIRALPSPSSMAAVTEGAAVIGSSSDDEQQQQQQQQLLSISAACDNSSSSSIHSNGAWLSGKQGLPGAAPGDEEQQLTQPLLRHAADKFSRRS
jgi:hypothetical protein